ncbi:MAG TPA: SDR family oxidoreductase [Ramlibacter sp.]|nr:SDR family oxidoreductase [Ramlibacter sp.]
MKVLVIGASRGIGLEFVRQYAAAGDEVCGTVRDDEGAARVEALGAKSLRLDVTDPKGVGVLAAYAKEGQLDVALYVAGIQGHGGATFPPPPDEFDRIMRTNVWGAMQAIPQLAPALEAAHGRFVFITSGMGRITNVPDSHNWVYRASKAALNMAVACSQTNYREAIFVTMSPGWVRTDLGGPNAKLSVEESVTPMRATIANLTKAHQGAFLNQDGSPISGW